MIRRDDWARRVLAVYPPRLRDRYGPEIRELLKKSRTPVRDLADVARTGLRERVAGPWRRPVVPPAVTTPVAAVVAGATPLALFAVQPWAAAAGGAVAGGLLARRGVGPRAAGRVVATVLALYLLPHLAQAVIGWPRWPELVATAAFAGGLALAARLLRRRPGLGWAVLVLPPAATTLFAALAQLAVPWAAYGQTMTLRATAEVDDALVYYPALYTMCAFLLVAGELVTRRRAVAPA